MKVELFRQPKVTVGDITVTLKPLTGERVGAMQDAAESNRLSHMFAAVAAAVDSFEGIEDAHGTPIKPGYKIGADKTPATFNAVLGALPIKLATEIAMSIFAASGLEIDIDAVRERLGVDVRPTSPPPADGQTASSTG